MDHVPDRQCQLIKGLLVALGLLLLSWSVSLAAPQAISGGASTLPPLPNQYGRNLAQNPGFESGLSDWTTASCVSLDSTVAHSSSYSAKLANCGAAKVNALTQLVSLSGHESLLVRFWVRTDAYFNGTFDIGFHDYNHGGGTALWTHGRKVETVGAGSTWVQIGIEKYINTFEHGYDSKILIELQISDLTSGTAWIDDVEVRQQWYPVRSFLKYPNYRGYLWTDKVPNPTLCGSNAFVMEICGVSEVDPPSGVAVSNTSLTMSLSPATHCSQNILDQASFVPGSSTVPWTLDGSALNLGTSYYVCTKYSAGGQTFVYPDWIVIPENSTFRGTLNNWFDVDGAWVHAGKRQFAYGTYDRWCASYRDGTNPGAYASGSECTPAQSTAEDCYIYDVQGMGTATPLAAQIPGLVKGGGPAAVADYRAQNFNVIMSIIPMAGIDPQPANDQLTPYMDALRDYGATHAQIANNWFGYLVSETDQAEAPQFNPRLNVGMGSISANYLFIQVTGVGMPAPIGTQQLEAETIPTALRPLDLQSSVCKGSNCSVSFTLPACTTSRWAGYYIYAAIGATPSAPPSAYFQRQYSATLPGQLVGSAPMPCGSMVTLRSLATTGINPPTLDETESPSRPIWAYGITDSSMLSTLAFTMSNPSHTGGAAFYVADEPNAEALGAAYRISSLLTAQTGGIPIWATLPHPSTARLWRDVLDIISVDPYGYGQPGVSPDEFWAGDTGRFTCTGYMGTANLMGTSFCLPERVDIMADELSRSSYGARPEWIVVQQYRRGPYMAIDYTEMRRQVFKALIGCQNWGNLGCGVLTWGWVSSQGMTDAYYVQFNTHAWSDSQAVGMQITALEPAIMSPVKDSPHLGLGSVVNWVGTNVSASAACGSMSAYANSAIFPFGPVRFVSKRMPNGDQYIFATNLCGNSTPFNVTFQLELPPADLTNVQVFGENRNLPLSNGQFTDRWNGYDVHVYYIPYL